MKNTFTYFLATLIFLSIMPNNATARFEPGTLRFGAGLGFEGSSEGTVFSFSGSGGVFVLKGFDVGLNAMVQTGGSSPTLFMLTGDLRYIPLPDLYITPYIGTNVGRVFIDQHDDAWIVGVGGGLLFMTGGWYGIDLGASYRWFFFPGVDPEGSYNLRVSLLLLF
jgi:hypothetical protein